MAESLVKDTCVETGPTKVFPIEMTTCKAYPNPVS